MNFKTTLILLVVCGALIALVKLIPDSADDNGNGPGSTEPLFASFEEADVMRVEIRRVGNPVTIVRRDGRFMVVLEEGLEVPADEDKVDDIIDPMRDLRPEMAVDQEKVTGEFRARNALTPDSAVVALGLADGRSLELQLGTRFKSGMIYASVGAEGRVEIISNAIESACVRTAEAFRDIEPVDLHEFEVKGLVVRRGEEVVLGASQSDEGVGEWMLTISDREVPGNRLRLEALRSASTDDLEVLVKGEYRGFVDDAPEDLSSYGLTEPRWRVELQGDRKRTILVGADVTDEQGEGFYWMVEGEASVYRSAAKPRVDPGEDERPGLLDLLDLPIEEYRPKSLLGLGFTKAESVGLTRDGETCRLARGEQGWTFTEPEGRGNADANAVAALEDDLKGLEVASFADEVALDEAGFGEGAEITARLELGYGEGQKTATFEVGRVLEDGTAYVRQAGGDYVVLAPARLLELLRTPWFRFRDRIVVGRVMRYLVQRVEVRHGDSTVVLLRVAEPEEGEPAWKIEGAEGTIVEDSVNDLLAHCDPFAAKEYVAAKPAEGEWDLSPFGLDDPKLTILLTSKIGDEDRTVTFRVGQPEEGGDRFAKLDGEGAGDGFVFTLKEGFWEKYTKTLFETD